MRRFLFLTVLVSAVAAAGLPKTATAGGMHRPGSIPRPRRYAAPVVNWHGWYYDSAYGMPVAAIVPPTADLQTKWGWGVGNTQVVPIWPQFSRNYSPALPYDPRLYGSTPPWPSHTDQFGDYYVRGPW